MYSITHQQLRRLTAHYCELGERLGRTVEEIDMVRTQLDGYFNCGNLLEVLQLASEAMGEGRQLVKGWEEMVEERNALGRSLDCCQGRNQLLIEQNQGLLSTIEELGIINKQLEHQIADISLKANQSALADKQIMKKLEDQLQVERQDFKGIMQRHQQQLGLKLQAIQKMEAKEQQYQLQIKLKDEQIELAQLVLQDQWNKKEEIYVKQCFQVCQTYSPSVNSHSRSIIQQSMGQSFCRNNRRNSLMQDLFQSQLNQEDLHFDSHFSKSSDTIQELQTQREKQSLFEPQLSSKISPSRPFSKLNQSTKLSHFSVTAKKYREISVQTEVQTCYEWLRNRIVRDRIKKHK